MTPEIKGLLDKAKQKGFTLVEMAVVMVIVGLLVGLGSAMIGPMMSMSKNRETKEFLGGAVESINSWSASNNRIPMLGDDAPDASTDEFVEVAKTPVDAWGRPLLYLYDANLYSATPNKDTICGRKTTPITISNLATPTQTISNVAFVVLSAGEDATVQATLNATTGPPLVAATLNGAASGPAITLGGRGTVTGTITLDANVSDIVRWVTLDELRSKIGCQGAQLKIVNNELPYGYISNSYNANITADGGVPYTSAGKYRWCIQGAAPTLATKPIIKSSDGTTDIVYNADCISLAENSWIKGDYISLNLSVVVASTKAYTCKTASSVTPPTPEWSEVGVNWTTTTNYSPSTTVVSGTNAYTCKQPHTSAAVNQPQSGANWRDYWTLTGTPWIAGSYTPPTSTYSFTTFVRDDNDATGVNDNIALKSFVLTINP